MWYAIGSVIKIILFLIGLFKQRDKERAEKAAKIGKDLIDAFKETDKKAQASRLNFVVGDIDRMRQ